MYAHLLIATDGSKRSDRAVQRGVELGRALNARVTLITVTQPFHVFSFSAAQLEDTRPEYESHMSKRASEILAAAAELAAAAGVVCERISVEDDQPSEAIIRAAVDGSCDLIVMGSHGRRGMERLLIGSETNRVLIESTIPVLVVPMSEAASDRPRVGRELVEPPVIAAA